MITVANYLEKKDSIDWSKVPTAIQAAREDVELDFDLYDDAVDVKRLIDLYIKGINESLSKVVDRAKIDNFKKENPIEVKNLVPENKPAKEKEPTIRETMAATKHLKNVMISFQQNALFELERSEEKQSFIDKIKKLDQILVDATKIDDVTPIMDKIVKMHFFYGGSDWYIFDYTPKEKIFFGYAILNGDTQMSEAGYISVDDLKSIKGIEMDFYFGQKELGKILHSQYPKDFDEYKVETKNDSAKREFIKIKSGVYEIDGITVDLNNKLDEKHPLMILNYDSPQWIESLREYAHKQNKVKAPAKGKKETVSSKAKELGQLLYEYANLSNRMVKVMSSSKSAGETLSYDVLNDKLQKTVIEISILIEGSFAEAKDYIKEWVTKTGSLFVFEGKKYLDAAEQAYNNDKAPAKTKAPAKAKVEKVIHHTIVDNKSPEFLLINRFWKIIKVENVEIPYDTVRLLYAAFNKAALERKVRKTSEVADMWTSCNKKLTVLFKDFAEPTQAPTKIEFTDKALYNQIKKYVEDVAINPAIPVLKRFLAMQNTKPENAKAELLLKQMNKIELTNNRLRPEILYAILSLENYLSKKEDTIDVVAYGLSVPRSVCTNRVKCTGIDKTGKLHKGYKFQEHTGNVVKVRAAPTKRKITTSKKKPVAKKKIVAGLGFSDSFFSNEVEKIYFEPLIAITNQQYKPEIEQPAPAQTEQTAQPVPAEPVVKNKLVNRNSLAYRLQNRNNTTHEYYEISNPNIANFLGKIEKKKKESVAITIAGGQGSGKTSFVFQLINEFAKNYKVGHASIEEHPESALYEDKANRFWNENAKATVDSPEINSLEDIDKLISRNDVIIIDSFSKLLSMDRKISLDETFRKKYDGKLFIIIYQLTTSGSMRGGSASQFDGDIILFVEKFPNFNENYVFADKNRYQTAAMEELHYNIANSKLIEPTELEFQPVERI